MLLSLTLTDNVCFFLYYGNLYIILVFIGDLSIGTLWDIGDTYIYIYIYIYIYTHTHTYTYRIYIHTHIYSQTLKLYNGRT